MKAKIAAIVVILVAVLSAGATSASAARCKIIINGIVVQDNNASPCVHSATESGSGGTVTNNIKVKAKTGKNTSTGGSIQTGNATAVVNITNNINTD